MFADVTQIQQAIEARQPQRQPDPAREVVRDVALFMLGHSVGKLLRKQAVDAQNRCW